MFWNTRYLISILVVAACVYSTKQEDVSSGKGVEVTINNDTEEVPTGKKETIDIVSGPTHLSHSNLSGIPPMPINISTTDEPTPTPSPPTDKPTPTPSPPTDKPTPKPSPPTDKPTPTPSPPTDKPTPTPSPPTDKPTPKPSPPTDKPTPKPSPPTDKPSSTVNPNSTTSEKPTKPTTLTPTTAASSTAKPSPDPEPSRKFDGPSFVGGIVLALGLVGIGFVAFKFYKARLEVNYHTL